MGELGTSDITSLILFLLTVEFESLGRPYIPTPGDPTPPRSISRKDSPGLSVDVGLASFWASA